MTTDGYSVLAIVPARSGSKGIANKNMAVVGGLSLIARAGEVLARLPWIDRKIISTDSPHYAAEGRSHGLDAPFLRPAYLSGDQAGALEMIVHALEACEQLDDRQYDVIVLTEPTSPLREPSDVEQTVKKLLETGADSAVTVSRVDTKFHPDKILTVSNGFLKFYTGIGKALVGRQQLKSLYSRNGLCYAFRRITLLCHRELITENTAAVLTDRPVANIDEPIDLLWAQFLYERSKIHIEGESAVEQAKNTRSLGRSC
jgi:CMP-N,N'-diacetyllegionaminic acid synthase